MAFTRFRGKTKIMYFEGDTAREVRNGGLVGFTDSGTVVPLRNDTTDRIIGVARRNDTTTDSSMVPVEVPVEDYVEWTFDVDSDAGLTDCTVGKYIAIDTTGGGSVLAGDSAGMRVDVSDTTIRTILVTGFISTTRGIGVLARRASVVMDTI